MTDGVINPDGIVDVPVPAPAPGQPDYGPMAEHAATLKQMVEAKKAANTKSGTTTPKGKTPPSPFRGRQSSPFGSSWPAPKQDSAPAKSSPPPAQTTDTAGEARLKKANANPALYDSSAPGHEAARRELRAALAQAEQEERGRSGDERSVSETADSLRSRFGVTQEKLPSNLERTLDYDVHSSNALQFLANEGVDAATVQSLYGDFERAVIGNGGARPSDAVLDVLQQKYEKQLGKATAALLRKWVDTEVFPHDLGE
jgi:hypothetical protein